ncbi:hypothetical protein CcCBS67573_g01866 [Chytriomyces confervae]|uniref:t-SNARE coiled-coil homology domain-containing protein n=1 Tax=Chytriomyces confervae TaxID=246404 RepID=A0A507FN38_9FUNG|nr:protein transport protein bet1 [Chytriomyces hyalinus]TPX76858.1 hypothetical protein CcCBS67573_g01866 [Chytriomyces confervae]
MSYRRPTSNFNSNAFGGEHMLMQQNDDHVDLMSAKVNALKEISLQIGDEVHYQNRMLNSMEDDFEKSGNTLAGTMKRLGAIAKSPNGFWMCWLMAFVVLVLVYIVFVHRRL